jgi:hypothetical protein
MNSTKPLLRDRLSISWTALAIISSIGLGLAPTVGSAQVRTKKPDRGVYQPPLLSEVVVEAVSQSSSRQADAGIADRVRDRRTSESRPRKQLKQRELVEVVLEEEVPARGDNVENASSSEADDAGSPVRTVGHEEPTLVPPNIGSQLHVPSHETWSEPPVIWEHGSIIHDDTCDGCPSCEGCDSLACDAMGCGQKPWYRTVSNASICCRPECWFGGIELLMMWRKGDRLPPLVTSTVAQDPDTDTAGQLGEAETIILAGDRTILKDLRAGVRFTIGTWLDNQQCRSLVMRGWYVDEETYGFSASDDQFPVIARPFLNVTDGQLPAQDAQLIAFPERGSGGVNVSASSDVFGGDLSVRQFVYGKFGGTVDMLYGYQYMRLNESLGIASSSTSLDDDVAPIGSVLAVNDSFKTRNEFHGGQVGLASRYRENCWSFNALVKVGFGSLQRRAKLAGATLTSVDGANAIDPNGLLVRSTNAGVQTDHTFGWVPELDLSLGWQQYPCFDVTFGYHIIAMTDALQVSGAIDPELAVNLADDPTGQQRPAAILRYNTFYVQGIHFGLQYVY